MMDIVGGCGTMRGGRYVAAYGGASEKNDREYHLAGANRLDAKIGTKPPTKAQVTAINRATRDRLSKARARGR